MIRLTFRGVSMSSYLSNSLEKWQRSEIEKIALRAYKLGKKHAKLLEDNTK